MKCPAAHLVEVMSGVRKAAIRSGSCGTDTAHLWYIKPGKHFFLLCPLCLHLPADNLRRLPRALAFLCSSGGLDSAKAPPPNPYQAHFYNKSFSTACLCLRLASGAQITANRRRNCDIAVYGKQPPTSTPALSPKHYRAYKNSRE